MFVIALITPCTQLPAKREGHLLKSLHPESPTRGLAHNGRVVNTCCGDLPAASHPSPHPSETPS